MISILFRTSAASLAGALVMSPVVGVAQSQTTAIQQEMIDAYRVAQANYDARNYSEAAQGALAVSRMDSDNPSPTALNLLVKAMIGLDDIPRARAAFSDLRTMPVSPAIAADIRDYAPRLGYAASADTSDADANLSRLQSEQDAERERLNLARSNITANYPQMAADMVGRLRVREAEESQRRYEVQMEMHSKEMAAHEVDLARAAEEQARYEAEVRQIDAEQAQYEADMAEYRRRNGGQ